MVLTILFMLSLFFSAHTYVDPGWTDLQKDLDGGQNLNESFFPKLLNYHINAEQSNGDLRKYMAKVIHSERKPFPVICTAVCISTRMFLTASRCVYRTTVRYVRLMYNEVSLSAAAFAVPQNETKQQFDDIGFIVTNREWTRAYYTIDLATYKDRSDNVFRWFASSDFSDPYIVVGYATLKGYYNQQENTNFNLTELPIVLNINLCHKILTLNHKINGFHVPCLHSCSYEQFQSGHKACARYHGVEGSAVINVKDGQERLYGIVTWGAQGSRPLPVGFTTINTRLFRNMYGCARKIVDDRSKRTKGHFQQLCDSVDVLRR